MDSINFQNIKVEKSRAKIKYTRLQKLTALFKLMELVVFLITISRFSTFLPIALKFSGDYFRSFFLNFFSPRFVFILGNIIVVILFLKSGKLSNDHQECSTNNYSKVDNLYDEYVESCQMNHQSVHIEEYVKINKQKQPTIMRRSQSGNLNTSSSHCEMPKRALRRSLTDRCLQNVNNGDRSLVRSNHGVDDMSNEEFRCRVEAFIARQQRLIKAEEEEDEEFVTE